MYFLAAGFVGYEIKGMNREIGSEYKVEINRLQDKIFADGVFVPPDLSGCEYVKEVTFLSAAEGIQVEKMDLLLQEKNGVGYQIEPVIAEGSVMGYVRYDYVMRANLFGVFLFVEVMLGIITLLVLGLLFYLRQSIVVPFHQFSELPAALAKGKLHSDVEESKSRYFGNFILGIGLLQDRLDLAKRKELKLGKERKMMILSLSHDIKTPLNNIKLYVKALEEDLYDTEEKRKKSIHQIGEKAEEIEDYVKQIVQTSREEIVTIEVNMGEFYIKELVQELHKTYQKRCEISHMRFEVGSFQNRLLKGDLDRAEEVMGNIMENAFKYGDGRAIEISFYEEEYHQLIRIFNTGVPIADQEFNHLFDSFFRGSNAQLKEGNGLGLYICKQIMQKMEGDIFAEKCEDGMAFILVFA